MPKLSNIIQAINFITNFNIFPGKYSYRNGQMYFIYRISPSLVKRYKNHKALQMPLIKLNYIKILIINYFYYHLFEITFRSHMVNDVLQILFDSTQLTVSCVTEDAVTACSIKYIKLFMIDQLYGTITHQDIADKLFTGTVNSTCNTVNEQNEKLNEYKTHICINIRLSFARMIFSTMCSLTY